MVRPAVMLTSLVLAFVVCLVESVTEWKTVLLVKESSTKNIRNDIFDKWGMFPPTADPSVVSQRVFDIAAAHDVFRSSLIDNWGTENHTEVRLAIFNEHGDILWHLTLDGFGSDLTNWNRPSRAESSSDAKLMDLFETLELSFDAKGLNVTRSDDGNGWLWVDTTGTTPTYTFSSRNSRDFPYPGFSPQSNSVVLPTLIGPASSWNFHHGFSSWTLMMSRSRYVIGIEVIDRDFIDSFTMRYTWEQGCLSKVPLDDYINYKDNLGNLKVFAVASYLKIATVTFHARCVNIAANGIDGTGNFTFNLYSPNDDYVVGSMFGIQWGNEQSEDPLQTALSEIQTHLEFDKYSAAQYRSQFTSAPDNRGSAVMFGMAGIAVFLLIIISIILLDLSTLTHQCRFMKRNFRDFRETLRRAKRALDAKRSLKAKKDMGKTRQKQMKTRLIDVKEIKVKVASGGGTSTVAANAVKKAPKVVSEPKKDDTKSQSKQKKSKFKKSVKNVINIKRPAKLLKIKE